MPDVEMTVTLLNLNYHVRGFNAIADLKAWLDENAASCDDFADHAVPAPPPEETGGRDG